MVNFSFFDGVVVSLISIFVVFVILTGLYVVISMFSVIFKEKELATENVVAKAPLTNIVEDEESKNVAMLTALILANDDKENKTYEVVSIENKN